MTIAECIQIKKQMVNAGWEFRRIFWREGEIDHFDYSLFKDHNNQIWFEYCSMNGWLIQTNQMNIDLMFELNQQTKQVGFHPMWLFSDTPQRFQEHVLDLGTAVLKGHMTQQEAIQYVQSI